MNYGQVFYADMANGIGCRISLFVSGCTHHCAECFNQETWDFQYGLPFDRAAEDDIIENLKPSYIDGLSLLGGEPMELSNQAVLRPFLERVKRESPHSTVWIYSGYTWEELNDETNRRCHSSDTAAILEMTDILVDGEFDRTKKDLSLRFRGSSNQRVIDVQESLKQGKPVLSGYGEKKRPGE
ncbi:anaerobic ribonucleoside-triphosphate reductase activating protein [Fusobacterium naviforme]|nr:anaerobic ribonucleoside-triphosphate reductase activating protein [Fusobacterium naviforme]PSL09226.1 anaerobic ribonucleoside-triphosphate reductase activating protein [Fusobacterium naviforme]STO27785.1 anaerobic ribonucleotide reductase-activating protein [Fusobacterium naviforme]